MNELRVRSLWNRRSAPRPALAQPVRRRATTGRRFRGPTQRRGRADFGGLGAADGPIKPTTLTMMHSPDRIPRCLNKNFDHPKECSVFEREQPSSAAMANANWKKPVFPISG
jgi:hypothetical protein